MSLPKVTKTSPQETLCNIVGKAYKQGFTVKEVVVKLDLWKQLAAAGLVSINDTKTQTFTPYGIVLVWRGHK